MQYDRMGKRILTVTCIVVFNYAFKFLIFHRFLLHVIKYLNKLNVIEIPKPECSYRLS